MSKRPRVVAITGASSGVGRATAREWSLTRHRRLLAGASLATALAGAAAGFFKLRGR
jgi:NAD(P)-dependent dehydrogenase (short-subunit alcohol dehydrogenase family)